MYAAATQRQLDFEQIGEDCFGVGLEDRGFSWMSFAICVVI